MNIKINKEDEHEENFYGIDGGGLSRPFGGDGAGGSAELCMDV
jgi:hypothetical protein